MPAADAFVRSGKVRDLFTVDGDRLLLVASDRVSAFDVVLPTEIPDKGRVLTGISRWWFAETSGIVANHLVSTDPADIPDGWFVTEAVDTGSGLVTRDSSALDRDQLRGRIMICRRADVLPVEVIVRGYLAGSGWKAYRDSGRVCGIALPAGLREGDRLPEPILAPSTKAEQGSHDENIDFGAMVALIGGELAGRVSDVALRLYGYAAAVTERAGILLADTKFEFGLERTTGDLLLVDEVLTPDSSRFWDAASYEPGGPQASFDKQFVRDWLEAQPWDKTAPGPALPADIVAGTRDRYIQAYERITGARFERYLEEDVVAR
jgi:phosphoribosylaminoimidazole-succinocarboxamide synthase